mgnify:CR=1 FL=1
MKTMEIELKEYLEKQRCFKRTENSQNWLHETENTYARFGKGTLFSESKLSEFKEH